MAGPSASRRNGSRCRPSRTNRVNISQRCGRGSQARRKDLTGTWRARQQYARVYGSALFPVLRHGAARLRSRLRLWPIRSITDISRKINNAQVSAMTTAPCGETHQGLSLYGNGRPVVLANGMPRKAHKVMRSVILGTKERAMSKTGKMYFPYFISVLRNSAIERTPSCVYAAL